MNFITHAAENDSHQWGLGWIDPHAQFGLQQLDELFVLLLDCERPPVAADKRDWQLPHHELHRFIDALPDEGSAQDGVATKNLLPGPLECTLIEPAGQDGSQLCALPAATCAGGILRKPCLLNRRQRINVLYICQTHCVRRDGLTRCAPATGGPARGWAAVSPEGRSRCGV